MYGAHINQVRAQIAVDSINTFRRSADIKSPVLVVSTDMADDVVILMAMHGIIVMATTCV